MGNICAILSSEYQKNKKLYETLFKFHFDTFLETHCIQDPEGYVSTETYYDAWLAYCKFNNLLEYRATFIGLYKGRECFNEWFHSHPSFYIHMKTLQGMRLVSFPTKPNPRPDAPKAPQIV